MRRYGFGMAISRREAALLAAGLVLGLAGAWALFGRGETGAPRVDVAKPATGRSAAAVTQPALVGSAELCSFDRVVSREDSGDGKLRLETNLADKGASDVRELLVRGKEAAASGRSRDAETAFLMACRTAGQLSGSDAILLADAMYRLGSHYAAVESAAPAAKRGEIRERARTLYATSLQAYRAKYGDGHERTRFAEKGLAALGGSDSDAKMVATATPKPAPERAPATPAPEAKKAPTPAPQVAQATPEPKPAPPAVQAPLPPAVAMAPKPDPLPPPVAAQPAPRPAEAVAANTRRARPSFDCGRARSTTERIICADEDLARQDRELGRLHARAKEAAADPRDFQRRSDAEWSRREADCTDRECLQRWYAQRRAELRSEAAAPRPPERGEAIVVREVPTRVIPAVPVAPAIPAIPAIVAEPRPAPATGDPAIGQATGEAGDTRP